MKFIVWLMSAINVFFGLRAGLNALGVLQTSKYSQGATIVFALLFLSLGGAGFYLSIARNNPRLALLVAFGPWVLAGVFLFITMVTSDYR